MSQNDSSELIEAAQNTKTNLDEWKGRTLRLGVEALKEMHEDFSRRLRLMSSDPCSDSLVIAQLKRLKMVLKTEIEKRDECTLRKRRKRAA